MKLRPYQHEAKNSALDAFSEHRSALLVLATGLGKTVVFSEIIRHFIAGRDDAATDGLFVSPGGRAMVIAHREELITQAANKIRRVTGHEPEIEMAERWADKHMFRRASCIVSSVQTLAGGKKSRGSRLSRFDPGAFSLLTIDEAHHATARTYRRIIDHFRRNEQSYLLGVTATPDRADEEALGQVFDCVPFVYEINDGIRDGWLAPIKTQSVIVEGLDLSQLHTTAGDLNARELAEVMEYESNLHKMASPTIELVGDRRTLVFATSVAHAERLSEIFNRHRPGCSNWIHGGTPKEDRRRIIDEYAHGRFQFLVNVGVATEGFDDPGIEAVVIGRPTKSRSLFCQMVGRGTRPHPNAGIDNDHAASDADRRSMIAGSCKPDVLILDFVGNAGRHKLITTADILGGKHSDEAIELAAATQAKAGAPVDTMEALEDAERELAERRRRDREDARRKVKAAAQYKLQSVDPFDVFDIQPERTRGWEKRRPPTEKMVAVLQKNGIDVDGRNFSECQQLIQAIIDRSRARQCTFKQARLLRQRGIDTSNMSFDEASQRIDALMQDNGPVPYRPNRKPETVNA